MKLKSTVPCNEYIFIGAKKKSLRAEFLKLLLAVEWDFSSAKLICSYSKYWNAEEGFCDLCIFTV